MPDSTSTSEGEIKVDTYTAFIREDGLYDMYFGRHDERPANENGYSGTVDEQKLGEIALTYWVHYPTGYERAFGPSRVLG